MNNKSDRSPNNILGYDRYFVYFDLQLGHANSGSSESDLVSGKMKEAIYHILSI